MKDVAVMKDQEGKDQTTKAEQPSVVVELQHIDRKQLTELARMCRKGMARAVLTIEYKMVGLSNN